MRRRLGPPARLPAVFKALTARVRGVCPGRGPRELSLEATRRPRWCRRLSGHLALVAQRIEHLTTDQKVGGSSPSERAQLTSPSPRAEGLFLRVREATPGATPRLIRNPSRTLRVAYG